MHSWINAVAHACIKMCFVMRRPFSPFGLGGCGFGLGLRGIPLRPRLTEFGLSALRTRSAVASRLTGWTGGGVSIDRH